MKQHGLEAQAVEVLAMEIATDLPSTFEEESCMKMVWYTEFGKGSSPMSYIG